MNNKNTNFNQKVNVQIKSEQFMEDETAGVIKYMTTGVLKRNKDSWEIIYKEPKEQGFSDSITTVIIGDNKQVIMDRIGSCETKMLFDKGRVHLSCMTTPFGDIDIQFLTNEITTSIGSNGGELSLSYSINHEDEFPIYTKLNISIYILE